MAVFFSSARESAREFLELKLRMAYFGDSVSCIILVVSLKSLIRTSTYQTRQDKRKAFDDWNQNADPIQQIKTNTPKWSSSFVAILPHPISGISHPQMKKKQ
jgi:hypothetical protein